MTSSPDFSTEEWLLLDAVAHQYGTDPGALLLWPPWRLGAAVTAYCRGRAAHAERMADVRPGAEGAMMLLVQQMAVTMMGGGGG